MVTVDQIQTGVQMAQEASQKSYAVVGERDACGFAWTDVYGVRSNSKQGKELIAAGFSKSYRAGVLSMWNPGQHGTQSITVKEAGAEALATYLTALGIKAYAGSRMD
jgi:hypothetical protein